MTTPHPIEQAIRDNIHAQNYGAAGSALLAVVERHQPATMNGRLMCARCWEAGFGQSPYPCGDLRGICHELEIDISRELEAIALANFDHAQRERT